MKSSQPDDDTHEVHTGACLHASSMILLPEGSRTPYLAISKWAFLKSNGESVQDLGCDYELLATPAANDRPENISIPIIPVVVQDVIGSLIA